MHGCIPTTDPRRRALFAFSFHCSCLLAILSGLTTTLSAAAVDLESLAASTATAAAQTSSAAQATAAASIIEDHLFWPDTLEWKANPPLTKEDAKTFATKVRTLPFVSLEKGCGRMKNRLATLEDGTRVCCRYRDNGNQLRGDVYAYHLSTLLGMWNVPPTAAIKVDLSSKQWRSVRDEVGEAEWKNNAVISVSLYVDGLEEEYFPPVLRNSSSATLTTFNLVNISTAETKQLMQWTDMIVFDFVMGHTDRLFNALLNSKWNSHMMEKPVHNLKKTASSSKLVLLDNESGFDIGYVAAKQKEEYYRLQAAFLKRICVFREQTIEALRKLGSTGSTKLSPGAVLDRYIQQVDPLSYSLLRKWRTQSQMEFNARVEELQNRLNECVSLVTI